MVLMPFKLYRRRVLNNRPIVMYNNSIPSYPKMRVNGTNIHPTSETLFSPVCLRNWTSCVSLILNF